MRIALIANPDKPDALAAGRALESSLRHQGEAQLLDDAAPAVLEQMNPDLVVVLGGDGTILRVAPAVSQVGCPVVGINFGKLGYLAAFSLEQFRTHQEAILNRLAPITRRLMLRGSIYSKQQRTLEDPPRQARYSGLALNDIVLNAGDPFRMVQLRVQIHETAPLRLEDHATDIPAFRSDGVLVATASGSTGYNLSAGGPLLSPHVEAMALTPICPHSLSFRPVVLGAQATVVIWPEEVNPGTKVNFDGQTSHALTVDEYLVITRAPLPLLLVENPGLSHWQMLAQKLHWARSPRS